MTALTRMFNERVNEVNTYLDLLEAIDKQIKAGRIVGIDLYCGLGGLTHGLLRGGVQVVAGVDIDLECRFPYERNNCARFIKADVRCLKGADLHALWGRGRVTLLAGCAPCQPFSPYSRRTANRRDDKWQLVAEFGRLVRESTPDLITVENVPQLAAHDVFQDLLATLDGYHVWWDIVQCADYGVPQTRRRLVLLASREGTISLLPADSTPDRGPATVRGAISHLPPLAAGEASAADPVHAAPSLRVGPKINSHFVTWVRWCSSISA